MAYQKDYNFIFENGDTFTLHAKSKGQARLLLSLFSPDRIGETAIGYVEGDKENSFKAKIEKLKEHPNELWKYRK